MITPNELRIGNFLQWKSEIPNNYFNVKSIEAEYDWYEECEGVLITKEWLLKLGFEQNEILQLKFDEYSKGFITLGKVVSGEELYQLIYDGKCFLTFVQYVHQLQNLYFVVTGKELVLI
jgi:hypothetical protein